MQVESLSSIIDSVLYSGTDDYLRKRVILNITFISDSHIDLYPHRLLYLEGELSIIGEDCSAKCVTSHRLDDIVSIKLDDNHTYIPNFSSMEINDFIMAIRAVGGAEERLVLKIASNKNVDLLPSYHFFGNPYVTYNSMGDRIWGASVELSEHLYEWLFEIREKVEILDPILVKRGILDYCEKILIEEKKRLKKAS